MNDSQRTDEWLSRAVSALSSEGYTLSRVVRFRDIEFSAVAHLSEFQLTKMGNSETFFVFGMLGTPTTDEVFEFSALAHEYSDSSKAFPLPRGLFESIWTFAVCIVDSLSDTTASAIQTTTPPRHFSAAEIPAVFDASSGAISYFEGTPYWGAAYYQGFRKQIQKYLVFH